MLGLMPIYEYRCASCSERFEELVRRPDETVACPECGGAEVERLLSVFAGVGGSKSATTPDYSRVAARHMATGGGCCGGACGHAH
jgi:putative FmdB family regulatory protein